MKKSLIVVVLLPLLFAGAQVITPQKADHGNSGAFLAALDRAIAQLEGATVNVTAIVATPVEAAPKSHAGQNKQCRVPLATCFESHTCSSECATCNGTSNTCDDNSNATCHNALTCQGSPTASTPNCWTCNDNCNVPTEDHACPTGYMAYTCWGYMTCGVGCEGTSTIAPEITCIVGAPECDDWEPSVDELSCRNDTWECSTCDGPTCPGWTDEWTCNDSTCEHTCVPVAGCHTNPVKHTTWGKLKWDYDKK